jgi:SWI/SNF-related matrix-associated actin-dependent regulator 1 of chromatin subfamily A
MNRLMDLGGYKCFTKRYCSGPNEASNLKELNSMLWQKCFFRREKKEVLTELPEMAHQILTVEITN